MTTKMRCKVRVGSCIPFRDTEGKTLNETLQFHGVSKSDGPYPADGSDENNTFSKWSPSVSINIMIANPALFEKLVPGEEYYVDFTPVPKPSTPPAAA
jgi:hypothetical protein